MKNRLERAADVNDLIRVIGGCGRKFFYYSKEDRYARIEVDHRGRVWWHDEYTNARIYTHYPRWGKYFSHGGTLKRLVNAFKDYVAKGKPLTSAQLGPWPDWYCNGNLWGYGDDMQTVRENAQRLGLLTVEVNHMNEQRERTPCEGEAGANLTDLLSVEGKRERMRNMVKSLTKYMETYDKQHGYENYTDTTFVDDVLYVLGIALQPEKYRYAGGYDEFKKFLKDHLDR